MSSLGISSAAKCRASKHNEGDETVVQEVSEASQRLNTKWEALGGLPLSAP